MPNPFNKITDTITSIFGVNKKPSETKFGEGKKLDHLKALVVIVKKGHGIAINNILIESGAAMTFVSFGQGTKEKYVIDILGGEEKDKEVVCSIINENKWPTIKNKLEKRFGFSNASKGVCLMFDIASVAGVLAYKYLSDYEGALVYGKEQK